MKEDIVKGILLGIKNGKTMNEIIEDLGINERLFLSVLEHLIREGYIDEITMERCRGCRFRSVCFKGGRTKIYVLSEKGLKFIYKEQI